MAAPSSVRPFTYPVPASAPTSGAKRQNVISLSASQLSPQVNAYTIHEGPLRTITIPQASKLSPLSLVTVTGDLLAKQTISLNPTTNQRQVTVNPRGYQIEADGDLHFCLGTQQRISHITCELQKAAPFLQQFQQSIGKPASVTGFFRCMFEHPGFDSADDAHIFEIHPVTAVTLNGRNQSFSVGIPDQKSIHTWTKPHPLNNQDNNITAAYEAAKDILTFQGMDGKDENYVQETGIISNVNLAIPGPSSFTFTSNDIGHPIQTVCLPGTSADQQLQALKTPKVKMIALRKIDLSAATSNRYSINLLAIDIQPS